MATKVARLYHSRGMRQSQIADALAISQARVSRLLSSAEKEGIVRTMVVIPEGLNTELEEALEAAYGLREAHVVDAVGEDDTALAQDLGSTIASVFQVLPLEAHTVGFTSWSRSLRAFASSLDTLPQAHATQVVEMLGGVGAPDQQIQATLATRRLANAFGAEPLFLNVPGVVSGPDIREALIQNDPYAQAALHAFDALDIALVGVGNATVVPPLVGGKNFFTDEQFEYARSLGAVGEVNLRFIDSEGKPIESELDDLVVGITLQQLAGANRRIGVAGGRSKYEAIRAALVGGWMNVLVTDTDTANYLIAQAPART